MKALYFISKLLFFNLFLLVYLNLTGWTKSVLFSHNARAAAYLDSHWTAKKNAGKTGQAAEKHASHGKQQKLHGTENDASSLWSNAFNFTKDWGVHVDPRTGILSTYIKAGNLLSNTGHGPDITLNAGYSSNSMANPDGLGEGWSWNLTHFNLATNQLTTSTGQFFYLQKINHSHWIPMYHKLKDILISGSKNTHFTVTYANGLREILNHQGYEVRLEQQNGWGVNFSYAPGSHLLATVSDDEKHHLTLIRKENILVVTSYSTEGKPAPILINIADDKLQTVTLPQLNEQTTPAINIKYRGHLIAEEDYPTGLIQKLHYDCSRAMLLPAYSQTKGSGLCVVSFSEVIPGGDQLPAVIRYQYSTANSNRHNYLAFNSGLFSMPNIKKDLLFETHSTYTYRTIKDDGLVSDIHTYNKYHLLIDDKKISDKTSHILSEEQNFYCRIDKINGCANINFDNLPVTYSLPLKTVIKIWGNNSKIPSVSSMIMDYDKQGHIIRTINDYGIITQTRYCPVKGDAACPAQPDSWSFSNLPESITIYPAKGDTSLTPVVTNNYYRKLTNLNNDGYILVLDHKTDKAGNEWRTFTRHYYKDKAVPVTYGLLQQTRLTGNLPKNATLTSVTTNYHYALSSDGSKRTTYSCVDTGNGTRQCSAVATRSVFTHQLLEMTDPSGINITRYHYDRFGRLIQKENAAGTAFAVNTRYQYIVSPAVNQLLITAPSGLRHKVIFDSLGRKLTDFSEAITKTGKVQSGRWLPVSRNFYNPYGQIIKEQHYIITSDQQKKVLTSHFIYDETGRICRVYLPDKEILFTRYEDHDRCKISYKEDAQGNRSPISVVRANSLDKPVEQITIPALQQRLPAAEILCKGGGTKNGTQTTKVTYDNFGRVLTITGPSGKQVSKYYDFFGRSTDIVNSNGDKTHKVYNLTNQVIQTLVLPAAGGQYLLSSAAYNSVGEMLWKAGEDGKKTTYKYTVNGQISTRTTPAGHVITWKYNAIGLPILKMLDGQPVLAIDYNHITRLPEKKTDNTGVTQWHYSDDGLPMQLIHTGDNHNPDYQLTWQYDNNRRVTSMTDISGNSTINNYDALGRISAQYYCSKKQSAYSLLYSLVHDGFSRVTATTYGSGMQRFVTYDNYGRSVQVRDMLANHLLSQWNYTFDADNNIITVKRSAENGEQSTLNYQYDALDNLISMSCSGSAELPFCPHDTSFADSDLHSAPVITQQDYTFTPLNQLAKVKEILHTAQQKTISKTVTFSYADATAPLRLHSIHTQWNAQIPTIKYFNYDPAGNMTTDVQQNQIHYNAFNQITQVITPAGIVSNYGYDGEGKEVTEQSTQGTRYLFYHGDQLINEDVHTSDNVTHTIGYETVAQTTDGIIDQFYEQNYRGDIVGVFTKEGENQHTYKLTKRTVYSPYGMSWHTPSTISIPFYQQMLLGFEGQRTDFATGWQFLGAGHRTYNPQQRYFVSEDPLTGGYGFGNNNPIMNSDPDGNMPKWIGKTTTIAGYIGTLGFSAVPKKWAHITGTVVTAALFVASMGALVFSAGYSATIATMSAVAVPASIPVIAAAAPPNKGLNIAGAIIGVAEFVASIAACAFIPGSAVGSVSVNDRFIDLNFFQSETSVTASDTDVLSSVTSDADTSSMVSEDRFCVDGHVEQYQMHEIDTETSEEAELVDNNGAAEYLNLPSAATNNATTAFNNIEDSGEEAGAANYNIPMMERIINARMREEGNLFHITEAGSTRLHRGAFLTVLRKKYAYSRSVTFDESACAMYRIDFDMDALDVAYGFPDFDIIAFNANTIELFSQVRKFRDVFKYMGPVFSSADGTYHPLFLEHMQSFLNPVLSYAS